MTRISVAKWGNSLALRLPKHVADDLLLSSGSQLEMGVKGGKLIVTPVRGRPKLADLVKQITPENRHDLDTWGPNVGREIW